MPNISSSQGMGQYRYDKNYSYIIDKTTFGMDIIDSSGETPIISKSFDIKPTYRNQGDSIVFRDIQIPLTSNIQYGKTYYLHLDLPQHIQYTTTVKVKLCTYDTSSGGTNYTNASLVDFQTIRELIIPPAPTIADQDAIEDILLYVDPISSNETSPLNLRYQADIIYDWPGGNNVSWKANNVYTFSNVEGTFYYKSTEEPQPDDISNIQTVDKKTNDGAIESFKDKHIITDYVVGKMEKRWLTANSGTSIASFDIVFSPTYNLLDGYSFILLEIDRSGGYQTQIQYIDENGDPYYGTYMALKDVSGELYEVPNLLTGNTSNDLIGAQIKSATGTLNHIAVWSHPELLLAINGEEIKIGQTNFYELDDFTITSLGVVAKDSYDRFTIDYQYQVN